jgi:hypothetical protein
MLPILISVGGNVAAAGVMLGMPKAMAAMAT